MEQNVDNILITGPKESPVQVYGQKIDTPTTNSIIF